ncbi:MAG: hypothetical protein O3C43_10600 [Verrucomicrobia bacterium]|nr:hypothetical protein [Verrucomicrobiota bacterium]MDA1066942.1 hypothetical protein [Verrucomicrobiota bacterium]
MKRFLTEFYGLIVYLCAGLTSLTAQIEHSTTNRIDKQAFREELALGDVDKIWQRIEATAVDEAGESVDSFKLCQALMIMHSSGEVEGYRDVFNPITREFLDEVGALFSSDLGRETRDRGEQLVLMGKLYEKYLEDADEAKACYLKVVNRYLASRSHPVNAEDWKLALKSAEDLESLNADERYAFKRLTQMRELEEMIAHRIASAKEQEAFLEAKATVVQPLMPEFNPDDEIPFEELRLNFLNEGGRK